MKQRFLAVLVVVTLMLALVACSARESAGEREEPGQEPLVITDLLGRQVEVPANPERFVNVGVGTLRLYIYVAPLDKLVGVEQNEKEPSRGVPYSYINNEIFRELPVVGQGGPRATVDPERILSVAPDVIFYADVTGVEEANELQEKTGIPVVVLSYGETDVFDEDLYTSLLLIGKITGAEERAQEVVALLRGYYEDLTARTAGIREEDRPVVYVGALGNKGPQGIESTRGDYTLLNVLNAVNVVDETGKKGALIIDREKLLEWDPEYIFIDLDGYHLVKEDYQRNPDFYDSLSAVQNGRVHVQLPYILLKTNLETAIADAYYMGTVLYPEAFSDIDPVAKADEIYINFLGKPYYEQMVVDYGGFGAITLGE